MRGTDHRFSYRHSQLTCQFPVAGGRDRLWQAGFDLAEHNWQTRASMPKSPDTPLPGQLYDLEFNTTYRVMLDRQSMVGVTATVDSSSDRPFQGVDEIDLGLTGIYRLADQDNHAWLFFLNYASRRPGLDLDHIPLPGLAYQRGLGGANWVMPGIPASAFRLSLGPDFGIELFYVMIRNLRTKLVYGYHPDLELFTEFKWASQSFLRSDRENLADSLVMHQKRLSVGADWTPGEVFSMGFEAGLLFDRFISETRHYSMRSDNHLELAGGWFGQLMLSARF